MGGPVAVKAPWVHGFRRYRGAQRPGRMGRGKRSRSAASGPRYVDRLAAPYFAGAAEWYETIGIGVTGGDIDAIAKKHLGGSFSTFCTLRAISFFSTNE